MDGVITFVSVAIGIVIGLTISIQFSTEDHVWQKQAIEAKCGMKNRISNQFQWIDNG